MIVFIAPVHHHHHHYLSRGCAPVTCNIGKLA